MWILSHCLSFSTTWHEVRRFGLALGRSWRNLSRMSHDDASDLHPRPGRIRDRGSRAGRRSASFVNQVLKAAARANGGPLTAAQMRRDGGRGSGGNRPGKGRCCRIGRGQAAADRLKHSAEQRGSSERMRRVVVKARIVRLKRTSKGADAHLRYLQRDGTTRGGERGRLYGPETDAADGKEFVEHGREDRHQFRFIVAPEDGDRLSDLRGFTHDVMGQMAQDLEQSSNGSRSIISTLAIRTAMSSSGARTRRARISSSLRTTSPMGCGCAPKSG
jgi:hypothetical protein